MIVIDIWIIHMQIKAPWNEGLFFMCLCVFHVKIKPVPVKSLHSKGTIKG